MKVHLQCKESYLSISLSKAGKSVVVANSTKTDNVELATTTDLPSLERQKK
jgi:hypothetical protein